MAKSLIHGVVIGKGVLEIVNEVGSRKGARGVLARAGGPVANLAPISALQVVNVFVYPFLLSLPALAVRCGRLNWLHVACIFSHVIRSLALW